MTDKHELDADIVETLATRNVEIQTLIHDTPKMGHAEQIKLGNEINRNRRIIELMTGTGERGR